MTTMTDPTTQPAPSRKPYFFVLQTGLITTALALFGVYWLNNHSDEQIMGWYGDYVIPAGAILVGVLAGSGYGIASWFTGVRISRGLMATVLILQTGAYIAAQYIDYCDFYKSLESHGMVMESSGRLPTFFEYVDFEARSFAWKPETGHENEKPQPMGAAGYFFVLLGAAGFIFSSLIVPAALIRWPYCEGCQRYMKTKKLAVLSASVPPRKVNKSDQAAMKAYSDELAAAGTANDLRMKKLRDLSAAGDAESFKQELAAGHSKAHHKLPRRMEISLVWCKGCENGRMLPTFVSGHGKRTMRVKSPTTNVSPEFVRGVLGA